MNQLLKILLFCFLFANNCFGQNLVPNPSFEDTVSCPTGIGDFSVIGWTNPTTASPDYFHSCNTGNAGVPQNGFGWQNARTGNAYLGGHTSDFSATDYREYVQCQLDSILQAGELYEVSFYVSRTDSSTKACDNIGVYLSSTAITSSSNQNLPVVPQVVSPPNNPVIDAIGWVQIIDTITAIGGEQFLTLGVFTNNANTNWIPVSGGWEDEAHYYYDDVSVVHVFSNSIDEFEKTNLTIYPNPSNGIYNVTSNKLIQEYFIFSSVGNLIINKQQNTKDLKINISEFAHGIYYINLKINNNIIRKKLIIN